MDRRLVSGCDYDLKLISETCREAHLAKLGDTKECRVCGEKAVLKRRRARNARFAHPGGAMLGDAKERLAWECRRSHKTA